MATIPKALQPPARAMTISQLRASTVPPEVVTQRELTPEEMAQLEEEFYKERGLEQSQKLEEAIKNKQEKIKTYKQQLQDARTDRAMESAENRLIRAEEELGAMEGLRGMAASGQYRYVDLISYAQAKGIYELEKEQVKVAQEQITGITREQQRVIETSPVIKEALPGTIVVEKGNLYLKTPTGQVIAVKSTGANLRELEAQASEIRALPEYQQYFAGEFPKKVREPEFKVEERQPIEDVTTFFGGKEISTTVQPQFGTIISDTGLAPWQRRDVVVRDISPIYSRGIVRRIEEFIPGAGIPITTMQEEVYLTSSEEVKKFNKLISSMKPGAARDLTIFLRNQQAKLKKDIGRYNQLVFKAGTEVGLTSKEIEELRVIRLKLNTGQKGTVRDIIQQATVSAELTGEKVSILGIETTPRVARMGLLGGVAAYKVERDVLAFQVGGATIAGGLGLTPTGTAILGTVAKVAKPLKYTIAPLGIGFGGVAGYQEYKRYGDIGDALAVGLGTTGGFFGAAYSREIFRGAGNVKRWIDANIIGEPTIKGQQTFYMGTVIGKKSKLAELKLKEYQKLKRQKISPMTQQQAISEFKTRYKWRSDQIRLIEESMKNKVYVTEKALIDDLNKWKQFLKNAGLSEIQISDRIGEATLRYKLRMLDLQFKEGLITEEQLIDKQKQLLETIQKLRLRVQEKLIEAEPIQEVKQATIFGRPSEYRGLGVYEKTEEVAPILIKQVTGLGMQRKILTKQEQNTLNRLIAIQRQRRLTKQESTQLSALQSKQDVGTVAAVMTTPAIAQDITTAQLITPAITTKTTLKPELAESTIFKMPTRERPPRRIEERFPRPQRPKILIPGLPILFPGEEFRKETLTGYHASVMVGGKYKRVTDEPYTRSGAKDIMARIVDNTISAQGRIDPVKETKTVKGKKKEQIKVFKPGELKKGDGYFDKHRDKFRGFKILKGRQVPMENQWIEKKNKRIDTPGEASRMTVAQFTSRQRKRAVGLPVRRKKSKRGGIRNFGFS